MTHAYGYAHRAQRLRYPQVYNRGKNMTMIGALGIQGLCAFGTWEGSMNRERFVGFLRDTLLPKVPRGSVLILDNLRAHHGEQIQEVVSSFGCSVLYLAPYCPQDNPIELCWSQVKHALRSVSPVSLQQRIQCAEQILTTFLSRSAHAWFSHCGYH